MKKLLLALPLLLLLSPSVAQSPHVLSVSDGESFDFILETYSFEYEGESETSAVLDDELTSGQHLTLKEGDTFTITVVNATPFKTEWGDQQIHVEYSANGQTINYYEWIDFGGFITYTNWDEIRSELESETDSDRTSSIIDTADEFGVVYSYDYTYSDATGTETETGSQEIRYEKSTGVINYLSIHFEEVETMSDGTSTTYHSDAVIKRVGYSGGDDNSDPGLALPGWELALIAPVLLSIVIIRRRK